MHEFLKEYLAVHGYWVLFLWTFLEGEAGLILAGFLAFDGIFNIFGVILTALAGAFCGDQFYFYLGRWKGQNLVKIFSSIAKKFRKALRILEKYGSYVAFISRFTYGFRIILPIVLGMTTFPGKRFLWLNILSALVWSMIFSLTGYIFGLSASIFVGDVSRYEHYLMLALIALIAAVWVFHLSYSWRHRRRAMKRLIRMKTWQKRIIS